MARSERRGRPGMADSGRHKHSVHAGASGLLGLVDNRERCIRPSLTNLGSSDGKGITARGQARAVTNFLLPQYPSESDPARIQFQRRFE